MAPWEANGAEEFYLKPAVAQRTVNKQGKEKIACRLDSFLRIHRVETFPLELDEEQQDMVDVGAFYFGSQEYTYAQTHLSFSPFSFTPRQA